ncbi:MAG: TauD/TfdA family dioxygenase [bacterium]
MVASASRAQSVAAMDGDAAIDRAAMDDDAPMNPAPLDGDAATDTAPLDAATIADPSRYRRWRARKLSDARRALARPVVEIRDPSRLAATELAALRAQVAAINFALYRIADADADTDARNADALGHGALKRLCRQVGLTELARNPFAHRSGVSEIRAASRGARRGYIPYTDRALNWHTDGYYNAPQQRIEAFAMHTVRAAPAGGENRLLDPEILYLLLRDRDAVAAAELFAPDALRVPPGTDADGGARPAHGGPVLSFGADRRLRMRCTLRRRHVEWKSIAARGAIESILADDANPFILTRRLAAGEGIISNNVLHHRAAFAAPPGTRGRLVLRARFHQRIRIEATHETE